MTAATLATYKARCDECQTFRYLPTVEQIERWALVHSRSYHHTVRLADGRVFNKGLQYGRREGER